MQSRQSLVKPTVVEAGYICQARSRTAVSLFARSHRSHRHYRFVASDSTANVIAKATWAERASGQLTSSISVWVRARRASVVSSVACSVDASSTYRASTSRSWSRAAHAPASRAASG